MIPFDWFTFNIFITCIFSALAYEAGKSLAAIHIYEAWSYLADEGL